MKLSAMRGYSGSGKSTDARRIANQTGAVVICRDDLRNMLHGTYWSGESTLEDQVTIAEQAQAKAFLKAGVSVVIDATHLHAPFLRKWARLASRHGAGFEVVDMIEEVGICKQRDHARMLAGGRYVGDKVIDQQVKRAPVAKWPTIVADPPFIVEPVEPVVGLDAAILVDIDGTLAVHQGRSPYDYTRVKEDAINPTVREIVNRYHEAGYWVFIMSGRDDTCEVETLEWLSDHEVRFDRLYMRDTARHRDSSGNKWRDVEVKYRLFNDYVRDRYEVHFVLDDRLQVCQLWHRLGLNILRVGDPDADF